MLKINMVQGMCSSRDGNNNPTKVSFFATVDAAFPHQAEDKFLISPPYPHLSQEHLEMAVDKT